MIGFIRMESISKSWVRIDEIEVVSVVVENYIKIVFFKVFGQKFRLSKLFFLNRRVNLFRLFAKDAAFISRSLHISLLLCVFPLLLVVLILLSDISFFGRIYFGLDAISYLFLGNWSKLVFSKVSHLFAA